MLAMHTPSAMSGKGIILAKLETPLGESYRKAVADESKKETDGKEEIEG